MVDDRWWMTDGGRIFHQHNPMFFTITVLRSEVANSGELCQMQRREVSPISNKVQL